VSGLHGTSDKLNIQGNVLAGTVNTVNVNLLDDPTTATTLIPLITISGTSAAGSFVLGNVVQNKSFLDVLVSTPGVYSLSITAPKTGASSSTLPTQTTSSVSGTVQATSFAARPAGLGFQENVAGLSDLGTLAASAAPGAQNLMDAQIGTLEARMGAVSQPIKGGFSLWTRAFANSGTVDPGHSAGNFGQNGNFAFDQRNSGEEVGLDFAISDEFKAGALFGKAQANQSLDGAAGDSGRITGHTSGVYGTWISPTGFYLDASYRWMSFNDHLRTAGGQAWIRGNADAFNLETGKSWTLQNGLKIAPQFQYTLIKVDNVNSLQGTLAGFQSNGDKASRARLGAMLSKDYTSSGGTVWMPYVSLSAVHEFDGKTSYSVNNNFFGYTDTKGTSALAETGINVQVGKLALYGGVNWQDGGALKSFFGGQAGLRYSW
ncbi:MAG: autotransporter outer membrane beta-barrel domain-containing protein, partial [Bryocella sp.]